MRVWSDASVTRPAFAETPRLGEHLQAIEQIKDWIRGRFALGAEDTILVSEVASVLPGCPPLQTAIAFWTADNKRHHFTVFKPALKVAEEDIPPAWMKDALALSDGVSCSCC
jgi:hypothetical protein